MSELGIELACAVAPGHAARVDSSFVSFVNHDVFFTSTQARKLEFDQDPLAYVDVLADPINRLRFRPGRDTPHMKYQEREYYFASDSTFAMFSAAPDSFLVPRFGMIPKARVEGVPAPPGEDSHGELRTGE